MIHFIGTGGASTPQKRTFSLRCLMVLVFLAVFFLAEYTAQAQPINRFQRKEFVKKNDTLPFRILFPKGYNHQQEYPLILFLHGVGERGSDNEAQLRHGGEFFVQDSILDNYPAIVVFPQCKSGVSWNDAKYQITPIGGFYKYPTELYKNPQQELLTDLLHDLRRTYPIDDKRIYAGGLSMGGVGAVEMVRRNPRIFAAAFVICGGGNPAIAGELQNTAWWFFHGRADNVVPPSGSKKLVQALKEKKAEVKITLYPNVGHDSWTETFANPDLMPWLFSKSR